MKALLLGGIGAAILMMLLVSGNKPESIADRIDRECERSYRSRGSAAVTECKLSMTTRYLVEIEREKAEATYRNIR